MMTGAMLAALLTLAPEPSTSGHATGGAASEPAGTGVAAGEAALRVVDDAFMKAFEAGDAAALAALYAEDAILIDPEVKGWVRGRDAIRECFAAMLAHAGKMTIRRDRSHYQVRDDHGWSASLFTVTMTDPATGAVRQVPVRASAVYELRGDAWMYVLDHASFAPVEEPAAPGVPPAGAGAGAR